jgi:hypothetical protein
VDEHSPRSQKRLVSNGPGFLQAIDSESWSKKRQLSTAGSQTLSTAMDCLLSLDGGGVRGLSTLYILKGLMDRLNHELKPPSPVKPCEVFDLIGGTSTGGYVHIYAYRHR